MTTRPLFPVGDESFVEGEVSRVTFENADTGFRVVRLTVEGRNEPVTVVGTLPPLHVGAQLRVRGKMETDGRHGPQLRAEGATLLTPSTTKGIQRYLGGGAIPGVGEKLATKIVDTFGAATLRVLDEEPALLARVPGLGKKRAERLVLAWRAGKAEREVLVFLQAHGASASLAARIARRYGASAVQIVSTDPYRLSFDVSGVGFRTADRIAHGLGLAKDSPDRIQAGLLQALRDETESGHVFAYASSLHARTERLLAEADGSAAVATPELLSRGLTALGLAGHVVIEAIHDPASARVFLPKMHAMEARLAARARELSNARVTALPGAEAEVARFEKESGVTLGEDQRAAVFEAAMRSMFILTGGPGVGKTTVLKAILSTFRASGLSVRLAAPTGRAAKRMTAATGVEATTIHRLLEYDPMKGGSWKRNARLPIEAACVIVDEASMIDLPLADALFQALDPKTRIVIVGDRDQLPSIGPGAVLRDLIRSRVAPCVELRRVFRQARESQIVINAHRIHDGEEPLSSPPGDARGDFFVVHPKSAEHAAATILELVTSRIPRRFGMDPVRDVQVLTPMHRGPAGSTALNAALQAALNPRGAPFVRGQRLFRVGDKVMQLKNDYDRAVWNGDIGIIDAVDPAKGTLAVRFDDEGRIAEYEGAALENLTLAYACSVHKAQGSEFPAVVIPLLASHFVMLSRNLLYTAVTRGRRLVVLVAEPRALTVSLLPSRREDRNSRLAERIVDGASSVAH